MMPCRPNIRISSSTSSPISIGANAKVPYIPPHPANGTPYHRYCLFLFENPDPKVEVDVSQAMRDASRSEFDLRTFVAECGFKTEHAGGAHFWRQVWDPAVSDIYRDRFGEYHETETTFQLTSLFSDPGLQEPRYGRPPKVDRYEEVKKVKRYI
jgi:large subunit ribosomal protein L35